MASMKLIDEVYRKYKKSVNMSFSELKTWSKTSLSRQASLTRKPINSNLRLLATPKSKWGVREVRMALKTINFIKRMKKVKKGKVVSHGLAKRDIALKNWGFNSKK